MRVDPVSLDREIIRKGSLIDFVEMAWSEVEPSPFRKNWHHEEVCAHLEAMSKCEIRELIINIPPGCTKSLIINVLWPAWEWIHRPITKWIYGSFDASLVGQRDGTKLINLLNGSWFRARWGELLELKNPSAYYFTIKGGGFRFSTSPGGKGTGRHANITVVDDPTKPIDVAGGGTVTKKALVKASEWWSQTMPTRQAEPITHRNLIVMQRLHNADLAGEMLRAGGYVHLCLPMRFVSDLRCRTQWGGDRRTKDGELLFPDRFPESAVKSLESKLGPIGAAAQLQQRPSVEGGGIFKREWWRFWHHEEGVRDPCLCDNCFRNSLVDPKYHNPEHVIDTRSKLLPRFGLECQSWDLTFKGSDGSDFVAAGIWRTYLDSFYLIDILNSRLTFAQTKVQIKVWDKKYPAAYDKLIEDAANGPAIESELKNDIGGITLVKPMGGKEARANAVSPLYHEGKVFLPHPSINPLVWQVMSQSEGFPKEVNDDLVDMQSQALLHLRQHGALFSQAMAKLRGEE